MSPILIGLVLFGVLLVLLALFAGKGASETVRPAAGPRGAAANRPLPELVRALEEVFAARGFSLLSESLEANHADLLLKDASPLTGQTVYVRCVRPDPGEAVESMEVQAALDRVHGEQLGKAIVVTPGTFSSEARLVARGANVELIDGPTLTELLEHHEPPRGLRRPLAQEPIGL